jgi:hypothetical protein
MSDTAIRAKHLPIPAQSAPETLGAASRLPRSSAKPDPGQQTMHPQQTWGCARKWMPLSVPVLSFEVSTDHLDFGGCLQLRPPALPAATIHAFLALFCRHRCPPRVLPWGICVCHAHHASPSTRDGLGFTCDGQRATPLTSHMDASALERRSDSMNCRLVSTKTIPGRVTRTWPLTISIPIMPLPLSIRRLDRRRLPCGIPRLPPLQLRARQPTTRLRSGKGAIKPWVPLS